MQRRCSGPARARKPRNPIPRSPPAHLLLLVLGGSPLTFDARPSRHDVRPTPRAASAPAAAHAMTMADAVLTQPGSHDSGTPGGDLSECQIKGSTTSAASPAAPADAMSAQRARPTQPTTRKETTPRRRGTQLPLPTSGTEPPSGAARCAVVRSGPQGKWVVVLTRAVGSDALGQTGTCGMPRPGCG